MAKREKPDPERRVRKLGNPRTEKFEEPLTDDDRHAIDAQIRELTQRKNELIEKKKAEASAAKAKIDEITASISAKIGEVNAGKRTYEVEVQEWLLANNEVMRARVDNDEPIGRRRTARKEELQEELPLDRPTDEAKAGEKADDYSDPDDTSNDSLEKHGMKPTGDGVIDDLRLRNERRRKGKLGGTAVKPSDDAAAGDADFGGDS